MSFIRAEGIAINHDAVVEVVMLATEDGGRQGPTPSHQFGCIVQLDGDFFDCRLDLSSTGPLSPGQTATVPVSFLHREDLVPRLSIGTRCGLREAHVIASTVILEVRR